MPGDALRILIRNPVAGMTPAEREASLAIIKVALDSGKTVVLGDERCFLCGTPLGAASGETKRGMGEHGKGVVFIKLCETCFRLWPGG